MSDTFIDKNGNVYIGKLFKDLNGDSFLEGKGKFITPTGITYEGYFIDGLMHGYFTVSNKTESIIVKYEYGVLVEC